MWTPQVHRILDESLHRREGEQSVQCGCVTQRVVSLSGSRAREGRLASCVRCCLWRCFGCAEVWLGWCAAGAGVLCVAELACAAVVCRCLRVVAVRLVLPAVVRACPGVAWAFCYALVTLDHLRRKIRQRRHCECGVRRPSWQEAWRGDAHADEHDVGVGGWWPPADGNGRVSTWESPCFALKVTPENPPLAFQRNGQACR